MSEERLEAIKDSVNFQLEVCKNIGVTDEIVLEEKELLDEVIALKEEVEAYRSYIENMGTEEDIDWMSKYV